MTCTRAREFLERGKFEVAEQHSASKDPWGRKQALELARSADRVVAAKGTKRVELDMKARPSDAEVLAVMLGPTGNLRAPTIRVGRTLFVGFPKEGFADLK